MLKYLMKYDLKKILKVLVWFYLISIVLAGITRLLKIWDNIQLISIFVSIFQSLAYSAITTIIINTFIHILLRFSTSFYKDQSYLTHTLPVKKDTLILSKYLSSIIVIVLSVLVSFLTLFIILYSPQFMQNLKAILNATISEFNISNGLFIFLFILLVFAEICTMISMGFTSICKGYSYNHKRGIKGFLWFAGYYIASMVATLLVCIIVIAITGNINNLFSEKMTSSVFLTIMIVALVAYLVYLVLFYLLCKKQFKKGVNVD